jgi:hypothetical protein
MLLTLKQYHKIQVFRRNCQIQAVARVNLKNITSEVICANFNNIYIGAYMPKMVIYHFLTHIIIDKVVISFQNIGRLCFWALCATEELSLVRQEENT